MISRQSSGPEGPRNLATRQALPDSRAVNESLFRGIDLLHHSIKVAFKQAVLQDFPANFDLNY